MCLSFKGVSEEIVISFDVVVREEDVLELIEADGMALSLVAIFVNEEEF